MFGMCVLWGYTTERKEKKMPTITPQLRKFFDIAETFESVLHWEDGSDEAWDDEANEPKSFTLARHFMTTAFYWAADYYDTLGNYYGAVSGYLADMIGYQEAEAFPCD